MENEKKKLVEWLPKNDDFGNMERMVETLTIRNVVLHEDKLECEIEKVFPGFFAANQVTRMCFIKGAKSSLEDGFASVRSASEKVQAARKRWNHWIETGEFELPRTGGGGGMTKEAAAVRQAELSIGQFVALHSEVALGTAKREIKAELAKLVERLEAAKIANEAAKIGK